MDPKWPLLCCLASSLFMAGLIWFVDVVHYPLFGRVDAATFPRYHAEHSRKTTAVVVVPMVVELVASVLVVARRPPGTGPALAWAGLAAACLAWAATAFLAVPMHNILARGFDASAHGRLVRTDRVRVVAWTVHSLLCLIMAARAMR